jgi:reactive intermediate/imine deaminase
MSIIDVDGGGIMRKAVYPEGSETSTVSYSPAILAQGKFLFVSGQVAFDERGQVIGTGDIALQATRIFESLGVILRAAGTDFGSVVKTNYYITDVSLFPEVAALRAHYFKAPYPASTIIEVKKLLHPDLLLEVEAVAMVP